MNHPTATVSVIIAARDEEVDLQACIEAIAAQTFPLSKIEVILVDGRSSDRTAEVARQHLSQFSFAGSRIVTGPGPTPANLNVGLAHALGQFICRVDARSQIPPDYVSRCIEILEQRSDVVVVGGAQVAQARGSDPRSRGIARALNNRYAMGFARYRGDGGSSGPTDTVYLGFFRTDVLRAVGGWDERFHTNQDFELNRRLAKGGTVWFEASLPVGYVPRASLKALFRQYHRFGRWKVRYWIISGDRPRTRQLILILLPVLFGVSFVRLSRKSRVYSALSIIIGLLMVEHAGGPKRSAGIVERIMAVTTISTVGSGWLLGMTAEGGSLISAAVLRRSNE